MYKVLHYSDKLVLSLLIVTWCVRLCFQATHNFYFKLEDNQNIYCTATHLFSFFFYSLACRFQGLTLTECNHSMKFPTQSQSGPSLAQLSPSLYFIATLGPTWEFQPCLKSCNLAGWTTKWHDYAMGTGHHIDSATDQPTT